MIRFGDQFFRPEDISGVFIEHSYPDENGKREAEYWIVFVFRSGLRQRVRSSSYSIREEINELDKIFSSSS